MREMTELQRAIYALASSPEIQVGLFPDFVCKGDELVLDFEAAYTEENSLSSASASQKIAFDELDKYIESHSGVQFQALYMDESELFSNLFWRRVRFLANHCIASMGWEYQVPPKSAAIYVRG